MDAFEDNTFGDFEKDPVADFLQREQDQLAGLQDNFGKLFNTCHLFKTRC